jgi:hypothetical protein
MDKLTRMRLEQEQRDRRQDLRRRLIVMDMMTMAAKAGSGWRGRYVAEDYVDDDYVE